MRRATARQQEWGEQTAQAAKRLGLAAGSVPHVSLLLMLAHHGSAQLSRLLREAPVPEGVIGSST